MVWAAQRVLEPQSPGLPEEPGGQPHSSPRGTCRTFQAGPALLKACGAVQTLGATASALEQMHPQSTLNPCEPEPP